MQKQISKQKNLDSQVKRIAKRTAQELFCVVLIVAKGYKVEFKKPRHSTKSKPFPLIERIYNDNEILFQLDDFNMDKIIHQSQKRQKEKIEKENKENTKTRLGVKEIKTTIIMNQILNIIKDKTIKLFMKRKYTEQIIPHFPWLSTIQIDEKKYSKNDIFELGEMMFDVVDATMEIHKNDLIFDYQRFVNVVNPSKNEKLKDYFNHIEHRRFVVYKVVDKEIPFQLEQRKQKDKNILEIQLKEDIFEIFPLTFHENKLNEK